MGEIVDGVRRSDYRRILASVNGRELTVWLFFTLIY